MSVWKGCWLPNSSGKLPKNCAYHHERVTKCRKGGDVSGTGDTTVVEYSRIDTALRQSEEEVEVCVYVLGEDDDIDDLFAEIVGGKPGGMLRTTYTEDGTKRGCLNRSPDQTLDDIIGP